MSQLHGILCIAKTVLLSLHTALVLRRKAHLSIAFFCKELFIGNPNQKIIAVLVSPKLHVRPFINNIDFNFVLIM